MKFYVKTDKHGAILGFTRWKSEAGPHYLTTWVPSTSDARLLSAPTTDDFMQDVLDCVTNSHLWLTKEIPDPQDVDPNPSRYGALWPIQQYVPTHLQKYMLSGDLAGMVEASDLPQEVKDKFCTELFKYMKELWEGAENCSKVYTVNHAMWAAGHVRHSAWELIQDWKGRPRGRRFEMKSRRLKDLVIIHTDKELQWFHAPYANVLTPETLVQHSSGGIYLLPWNYSEERMEMNHLVLTSLRLLKARLKLFEV